MEALDQVLKKWLQEGGLSTHVEFSMQELLAHRVFREWSALYPEWEDEDLQPFVGKIRQFIEEQSNCQQCDGLYNCRNMLKGHAADLFEHGAMLEVTYIPCHYYQRAAEERRHKNLIRSHHIPKDILTSSFRVFEQDDERADAFEAVLHFCQHTQPGQDGQGLYLYGPLGTGKSFLLGAACNKLAERDIASYMVYTPSFFREIKGAIADHTVEEKIRALQSVPVLILDDIGAETITPWVRDEVLGPVLQYRVTEKLPTLYTSNYNYDQLEEHMAYTQRGGIERIDELKAKRIMERIRHYTDAYQIIGRNRRSDRA